MLDARRPSGQLLHSAGMIGRSPHLVAQVTEIVGADSIDFRVSIECALGANAPRSAPQKERRSGSASA